MTERNQQINGLVNRMLQTAEELHAVDTRAPLYVLGALAVLLSGRKPSDYAGPAKQRMLVDAGLSMTHVAGTVLKEDDPFPSSRHGSLSGLFKPRPFDQTVADLYRLASQPGDAEQTLLLCAKEMHWMGETATLLSEQVSELQGIMEKAVPWEETEGWLARHVDHGEPTTEEIPARQGVTMTRYTCPCGAYHVETRSQHRETLR